ncbi:DUF7116 family protein [Haloarchaeobius amylolyticus]|uniref:DUF7116 family protein n=1 Tax=Haloarchaeobius amylolyticus TaxID=1198296 RepID=UPI002270E027|nr:hypothetical protein [Haloarchaeobius amylolyticus]
MCPVNTNRHIGEQARKVFDRLGYTVTGDGDEFRAERDWKVVHVTATTDLREPPSTAGDGLQCFVTNKERAERVRRRVSESNPAYEWAVIGVGEDDQYVVERAPPS